MDRLSIFQFSRRVTCVLCLVFGLWSVSWPDLSSASLSLINTSKPRSTDPAPRPLGSIEVTQPAPNVPRVRIVAFGDSLTAGFGVPREQSYPAQLQTQLTSLGYEDEVVNAGVSGETTAGGLRRMPWVLRSKPQVVILELGGNDGLRGLSLADTRSNLDAIIRGLKEAQVQVVLAGMKLPPNYGEEYTKQFEGIYRELAAAHHIPLIPFLLEGVGGESRLNQADGIHPTSEGYRKVAATVLKTLVPVLEDIRVKSTSGKKKTRNGT